MTNNNNNNNNNNNTTNNSDEEPCCIHVSFHQQAAKTPDAPCLVDAVNNKTFTYQQVQAAVITLAAQLRDPAVGAAADKVVALYMEPSPDFVVTMLAILTAGAAYVPLELAYPTTMLQRVLQDAQPVAVVTHRDEAAQLPLVTSASVICLDDQEHKQLYTSKSAKEHAELVQLYQSWPVASLDDLAFIVYSSGTTGQPKGIANPHRAPALSYNWRFETFVDYTQGDRVACNVFFVWEALRPIMRGGAVVPVTASIVFDGEALSELLENQAVTEMLFTPSLLENLFNTMSVQDLQTRLKSLKTVFLNGEVVTIALRNRCLQILPHISFINLYSISECHEIGAVNLLDINEQWSTKFCPIGQPCSVSPVYILEEDGKTRCQDGNAGELYVGGAMLAQGYLNLPELTQTRFVKDPFVVATATGNDKNNNNNNNKQLMYRTGDRARMLPNGQLEILGRCDFMVKIRGYSIVLGAVEAALVQAVALSSCVVVADGEEGEDKHLVAYLVRAAAPADGKKKKKKKKTKQLDNNDTSSSTSTSSSDDSESSEEVDTRLQDWHIDTRTGSCPEIRRAVDGALPHYMVPAVYIEVETLPVSAVGAKLDRKALAAQSSDRRAMLRSLQLSTATHSTAAAAAAAAPATPGGSAATMAPATADAASTLQKRCQNLAKYWRVNPTQATAEEVQEVMATLWEVVLNREMGTLDTSADFHENGGHSLSAARLASIVNKVFGSHVSPVKLLKGTTVGQLSQLVIQEAQADAGGGDNNKPQPASPVQKTTSRRPQASSPDVATTCSSMSETSSSSAQDEAIRQQVRNDAILPSDISFQSSNMAPRVVSDCSTILLTGATGYFGAHVLAELLKQYPTATVKCLCRSADPQAVQSNLQRYKLWDESFSSRLVVMKGDLSLPKLGLTQQVWDETVSTVDAVFHCGAAVSLTAPYSVLRSPNVQGTLQVIRLASACQAGTPLVYVSSNGIFPIDNTKEVFMENDNVACLPGRLQASDGYGLSKWAAEQLVLAAGKAGLPTLTVRFGNLGWHSKTGLGNQLDFQGMILNGCRRIGARPDSSWTLEVTPVDFAASALVALANQPEHLQNGAIFHCVQSEEVDAERVFEWVTKADGHGMTPLPFDAWVQKVEDACQNNEELVPLAAFVTGLANGGEEYITQKASLDCSKFDTAVRQLGLHPLDASNVETYYRTFLRANHVVPPSMSSWEILNEPVAVDPTAAAGEPAGPLAGKVAVVTGASSGIGRAVVLALVQAGCHVAMGARRLVELEKTHKQVAAACPGSKVKTLSVRTDVTKREDVAALVKSAEVSFGPVDILVNCAGVMYFTLMKNVLLDQWDQQIDVNCKGSMYGIANVLPSMLERGSGHIVNITSDAGRKSFPGLGVYSGSKFFVEAVSQALRAETASTGLRVTCIQPGNVETPLLSKSTDPDGLNEYGTPSGAKVLEPADIGRAVVYALTQPEWCAVNEILVEPREEPA